MQTYATESTYHITFLDIDDLNANNTKYINLSNMKLKRVKNGAGKVLVGSAIYDRDMDDSLRVSVGLFMKQAGEYRITPYKINATACSMVTPDNMFYMNFAKCHGLPTKCPIRAGTYTCKEGNTMESELYPPVLRSGDYMLEVRSKLKFSKCFMNTF